MNVVNEPVRLEDLIPDIISTIGEYQCTQIAEQIL